jgi:hypothetical protein
MSTSNIDRQLDLAIDALNREQSPGHHDGELAGLVNTARLLKRLRPPADPDAGFPALALDRIMDSLGQPTLSAVETPLDDDQPRGIAGWLRKYSELAAILIVGMLVIGGVFIYQTVWTDDGGVPAVEPPVLVEDFEIYRITGTTESAAHLQQINPESLDDIEAGHRFDITYPYVLSQDGSTVVWIEPGQNQERIIVVGDGLGGSERLSFSAPSSIAGLILSHDGSRLAIPEAGGQQFVYVYDTVSGEVVTTIPPDGQLVPSEVFFSPDGATLYGLWAADSTSLIAFDLASGEEVARHDFGNRGDLFDQNSTLAPLASPPAAAISPDGTFIAAIHGDDSAITIVNARTLETEKTFDLGILTTSEDGKDQSPFARREITFAADNRHLYLYGIPSGPLPNPDVAGLMLVDTEQEMVVSTAVEGAPVDWMIPSPDGNAIYVITIDQVVAAIEPASIIRRLDALTLEIQAERQLETFSMLIIDPMPRERPDPPPVPTVDPDASPTPDEMGTYRNLTFEQAQELVPFELVQPPYVPEPLEFSGINIPNATADSKPTSVVIVYKENSEALLSASLVEFRQAVTSESGTFPVSKVLLEQDDSGVITQWSWASTGMHFTITGHNISQELDIAIEELIDTLVTYQ